MKKLLKAGSALLLAVFFANTAYAQGKLGYIALSELTQLMPEFKAIQTQLSDYEKEWLNQLQLLNDDLSKKSKDYQAQQSTMADAVKVAKQTEILDAQKRLTELDEKARVAVEAKAAELSKPLDNKVRGAIKAVATEKGYTYVFNSNQTDLAVAPDADNLMPSVKIKLGLK